MTLATHSRFTTLVLLVAALAVFTGPRAEAQINPLWDHYKLYNVNPPVPPPAPLNLRLTDQFGFFNHQVGPLDRYMNPTEKTVFDPPPPQTYPINDPILHYSWWRISPQPFNSAVTAVNQFGDHHINLYDAIYLLNPSLKNQPGTQPPLRNHYKCYQCDGPPVNVQVGMADQFGPWNALVTIPRFFCNPVEKEVLGTGVVNPILDPNQHYICYEFQPIDPNMYTATITDQFITGVPVQLGPSDFLCVPTYKTGVTVNRSNTWGKLKTLYR